MTEPLTPSALADAFRKLREMQTKPVATRIKVGQAAWPKLRKRIGGSIEAGRQLFANPFGPMGGIPVHVLEPLAWPPNLVAVLDQEGNAMTAWIIND